MPDSKVDASALTGVSETTLWTLYCCAHEASRTDPLIDDPLAVQHSVTSPRFDDGRGCRLGLTVGRTLCDIRK